MIAVVIGTRAELIRCATVLRYLESAKAHYVFIHTGQNPIDDLVKAFGIQPSQYIALSALKDVTVNPSAALYQIPVLVSCLRQTLHTIKANCVVCHGDTFSTLGVALANRKNRWKTAHIEAGFRSHSILEPFPEELFRIMVDKRSDILFAPSLTAGQNLVREKVDGNIVYSGSTVCDVVEQAMQIIGESPGEDGFALVTAHRSENIYIRSRLKRILEIIGQISIPVIWPLHEVTRIQLMRLGLLGRLKKTRVRLLSHMNYFDFIKLLLKCKFVLTDGGSIEEESIILKKPCLLLRKRTERVEGLRTGITFLTNLDLSYSRELIERMESKAISFKNTKNPYRFNRSPSEIIACTAIDVSSN